MDSDLDIATKAALAGAKVVRSWHGRTADAEYKGTVDPVTAADRDAENAIVDILRTERPADDLLTEESGEFGIDSGRQWIVDPLDGTVNFLHGVPHVGVSIALYERDQPKVAVIVDVFRQDVYRAESGAGAELNDLAIRVSETSDLGRALVATGFPYDRQEHAFQYSAVLASVLKVAQGVRRVGSAALDFAYVAAGRYDAFWEFSLATWDTAAGLLLVQEADGMVTDGEGAPFQPGGRLVIAGNRDLAPQLRETIAQYIPAHLA